MSAGPSTRSTLAGIASHEVLRVDLGSLPEPRHDDVAVEEPLEIRIAGEAFATTMRTPGQDMELVAGFLLAEGLIRSRAELGRVAHCGRAGEEGAENVVDVLPASGVVLDETSIVRGRRGTLGTAACGVCGRAVIDDLVARLSPPAGSRRFSPALVARLPEALRSLQPNFARTGGLHAAGVTNEHGELVVVREDVGRHNAVDKSVGRLLLDDRLPATDALLVVSGRTSFEIVQKALAAGMAGVVSVSAPSSLAISTARRFGVLLAGFTRGGAFTVYASAGRLDLGEA